MTIRRLVVGELTSGSKHIHGNNILTHSQDIRPDDACSGGSVNAGMGNNLEQSDSHTVSLGKMGGRLCVSQSHHRS